MPFIGEPHFRFEIKDQLGCLQQIIGGWNTAWGPKLLLSFTLCHRDEEPLEQRWLFLRPKIKMCPYGLDLAIQSKQAKIIIHDNLKWAKENNEEIIKPLLKTEWLRV